MLLVGCAAEPEVGLAIALRPLECLRMQRLLVLAVEGALLRRLLLQVHVGVHRSLRAQLAMLRRHLVAAVFAEAFTTAINRRTLL